mgnify:FL=1
MPHDDRLALGPPGREVVSHDLLSSDIESPDRQTARLGRWNATTTPAPNVWGCPPVLLPLSPVCHLFDALLDRIDCVFDFDGSWCLGRFVIIVATDRGAAVYASGP